MIILCPECGFERTIDDSKVPPSVTIATCPKCQHRFRFRNSPVMTEEPAQPEATPASGSVPYEAAPQQPAQHVQQHDTPVEPGATPASGENGVQQPSSDIATRQAPRPSSHEEDDPLPPGAVIPGGMTMPDRRRNTTPENADRNPAPSSSGLFGKNGAGEKNEKGDVWDAVSSVGDRWKKLYEVRLKDSGMVPPQGDAEGETGEEIPWERLDQYGFFPGLYQTIIRVMFSAPRFFANMRPSAPLTRPLAFFVLLGILQSAMERFWYLMTFNFLGSSIDDPQLQAFLGGIAHEMSLPMALLLSPFILTLQLFALSGLYHMMLRLVQPDRADFPTMFRVVAYAAAPTVVCIVPLLGPIVGTLLFLVWAFIGCKFAFKLPWNRVVLALAPLYILGFAIGLQLIRLVVGNGPV